MSGKITTGIILAGSGVLLMARLRGNSGQLATQASFSSITYQATNLTQGAIAGSGALSPAAVLFNALVQGDLRWTSDSASQPGSDGTYGYNFLAALPASIFAVSGVETPPLVDSPAQVYQIDLVFTPADGSQPFRVSFQAPAIPVYV